jgi:AmiR/NasT family two-component response regulator
MDVFALMGFIFGMSALAAATTNTAQVKKLKHELEDLKKQVESRPQ